MLCMEEERRWERRLCVESPAGSWRVAPSVDRGQGEVRGVGHWNRSRWRRHGGIQLQDLLSCFPVGGCALAEAVVRWDLGSDLAFRGKVVAAARSCPLRAAVCWLRHNWALQ